MHLFWVQLNYGKVKILHNSKKKPILNTANIFLNKNAMLCSHIVNITSVKFRTMKKIVFHYYCDIHSHIMYALKATLRFDVSMFTLRKRQHFPIDLFFIQSRHSDMVLCELVPIKHKIYVWFDIRRYTCSIFSCSFPNNGRLS